MRAFSGLLAVLLTFTLVLAGGAGVLADASDKEALLSDEPGNGGNVEVLTNGILVLSVENGSSSTPGLYTVGTGNLHPHEGEPLLYSGDDYSPGTSYLTVCDYTDGYWYVSDSDVVSSSAPEPGGIATAYLGGCSTDFSSSGRKATTVWEPGGGLRIEQETAVEGSGIGDSRVRVTTTVENTDSSTHEVGIRYLWDLEVGDSDNAWFARRGPDSAFTQDESIYTPPEFDYWEFAENPGGSLSAFGTAEGPRNVFSPNPSAPERLIYAYWSVAYDNAWEYPTGYYPGDDSAALLYWGWDDGNSPITLSSGESVTVTAYIFATGEEEEAEEVEEPEKRERRLDPAAMTAAYMMIDPQQVLPGQEVRISANICNSGEMDGSETAVLSVNGASEQSQSVTVSGGSCKQVVFTTAKAVPGTYQVSVNGMQGQFSVLAPRVVQTTVPSQQDVGLGTWGIVAIAAVAVALIAALVAMFR